MRACTSNAGFRQALPGVARSGQSTVKIGCSSAASAHFDRQPQADSARGCMSTGPTSSAARLVFLSAGRAASSLGSEPAILSGVDRALLLKLGLLRENTGCLVMWRWMSSQSCCLQAQQVCAAANQELVQHLSCALATAAIGQATKASWCSHS